MSPFLLLLLLLAAIAVRGSNITISSPSLPANLTSPDIHSAIILSRSFPNPTIYLPTESPTFLTSTITLTSEDSDLTITSVSGSSTFAQLSGGVGLTDWTLCPMDEHLLCAPLPEGGQSRHLIVDGRRVPRSLGDSTLTDLFLNPVEVSLNGYILAPNASKHAAVQEWLSSNGTASPELVFTAEGSPWTESRCTIRSVSVLESSGQVEVTMANPCFTNVQQKPCNQGTATPAHIENSGKSDLREGEFFVDEVRGVVMYFPLAEEVERNPEDVMEELEAVMPILEVLISSSETEKVKFEYIEFMHATYNRPSSDLGYVEQQSGALVEHTSDPPDCVDIDWKPASANLIFNKARDVSFISCSFIHLSAVALSFSGGSHNCIVSSCLFTSVGGAGVQIGSYDTYNETDFEKQDAGNVVVESRFDGVAGELHGNAGVQVGYSRDTVIENNHLSNLYYTGISIGWGWSREVDTYARNNSISGNRIDGFKLQGSYPAASLGDGGGIYALGPQQGSVMKGNWLNHMGAGKGGGAIYPDEGSAYWEIAENVFSNATMCEDDCEWLHIWTSSIHDIEVRDCFTDTDTMWNDGTDTVVEGTTIVKSGTAKEDWPDDAVAIMDAAGPKEDLWFYEMQRVRGK